MRPVVVELVEEALGVLQFQEAEILVVVPEEVTEAMEAMEAMEVVSEAVELGSLSSSQYLDSEEAVYLVS